MARVQPPVPTTPPTPPIQRGDRATFSNRVDAAITYLTGAPAEIYGLATNVYNNAVDAFSSATAAATSASDALSYRGTTLTYRNEAQQARTDAQGYAQAASASATSAAASADSLTGTSGTSNVIGAGTKTWFGAGLIAKSFKVGQRLRAANPGNVAQWMEGLVTGYTNNGASSALTMNVTDINSAAAGNTVTSWSFTIAGIAGAPGAQGGITGGSLTGALNEKQGATLPNGAVPDIWSAGGNLVVLLGTDTITGFPDAPQLGASRTVMVAEGRSITNGANLIVYGGTQVLMPGDLLDVVTEGAVSKFRVTIRKRDGSSVTGAKQYMVVLTSGSTWTVDATSFEVEVQAGGQGGHNGFNGSRAAGNAGFAGAKRFVGATVGSVAAIGIGGVGAPGTNTAAPASGGTTTFALSGFTTLTATFTGCTGADQVFQPRPGANTATLTAVPDYLYGQGGDSHNGFGGEMSYNISGKAAVGYGAGGGGGAGLGTPGCIIIRYFK